jgi:hypothetical protein
MVPFEKHYGANMSSKRALLIVALAVASFAVVSEALALDPQPLPPRWSHPLDLRRQAAHIKSSRSRAGSLTAMG